MGYVLDFQEIDHTHVAVVGGKGALLGSFRRSKASPCRLIVRDERTLPADPGGERRRSTIGRSALALGAGGWGGDPPLSAEIRRAVEGIAILTMWRWRLRVRWPARRAAACAVRSSARRRTCRAHPSRASTTPT